MITRGRLMLSLVHLAWQTRKGLKIPWRDECCRQICAWWCCQNQLSKPASLQNGGHARVLEKWAPPLVTKLLRNWRSWERPVKVIPTWRFLPWVPRMAVAESFWVSQVSTKCQCPQKERESVADSPAAREVHALIPNSSVLAESDCQPQGPGKQYFKEGYSATDKGFASQV